MPKVKLPKVYKVKKSRDEDQLVIKFKNLSKQQLKEWKADLDAYCKEYFKEEKDE